MNCIIVSDIDIVLNCIGLPIIPDNVADEFYHNHSCSPDASKIIIQPLPSLPDVGGNTVWKNEICEVRRSGEYEIRVYKDSVTQNPYAIYSDHNGADCRVLVKQDWLMQCKDSVFLFNILALEKQLIQFDRLVFHTCFIEYKGEAILFTGHSGAGKSTQGDLWNRYRNASILNGDRCVLGFNNNETPMAYGFPFSGTSGICHNQKYPIKAIVFIKQALKNSISRIGKKDAVQRIWQQITANQWNMEFIDKVLINIERLVDAVAIYELSCTPDEDAVICLEQELDNKTKVYKNGSIG